MPLLTVFTAPKPFTNPHIALIQRNALRSWMALGPAVQIALIGQEQGMTEVAREYGLLHLPEVQCNALGTPLVSSIFELGRSVNSSPFLAYVNADILLFPETITAVEELGKRMERFLLVGQRWDLEVKEALDFSGDWAAALRERMRRQGKLHVRAGSDYFIFPRECFTEIPPFSVGRAGWDNWMIYFARKQGWPVVDGSGMLDVIHQSHDYSHLPNGQPHYRLPETGENIRLAGGRRTIFTLDDATHEWENGNLRPVHITTRRFFRGLEVFPLLKHGNYALTQALFSLFHPRRAFKERQRQRAMAQAAAQSEGNQGGI